MQVEGLEMNMVSWSLSKQALGTQGPSMRLHLPRDLQHLPVDTLGTKSLVVACEGHSYTFRHPRHTLHPVMQSLAQGCLRGAQALWWALRLLIGWLG